MAGIDVGGHGGKRTTNHDIPLIPFIDFLLCLVAFLLVTAVWSQMARLNADARVPGPPKDEPPEEIKKEKQLPVEMKVKRPSSSSGRKQHVREHNRCGQEAVSRP